MLWIVGQEAVDVFRPEKVVPEIGLPEMDHHCPRHYNKDGGNNRHPGNTEKFSPTALPYQERHNGDDRYRKGNESLGKERQAAQNPRKDEQGHFFPGSILPVCKKEGDHGPGHEHRKCGVHNATSPDAKDLLAGEEHRGSENSRGIPAGESSHQQENHQGGDSGCHG